MESPRGPVQAKPEVPLKDLAIYFFRLGAFGFGGPIALAGYMQRDLQEERGWITPDEFQDGLAIAQTMPGPLAAQLAMWIGYIRHGILGATVVGVLFVLPPFVIVVAVAAVYVALEGIAQIRAIFYGVGPAAIAIITLASWKLARSTDKKDAGLWGVSIALLLVTVITRTELAWLFVLAGFLGVLVYAPPWRGAAPERQRGKDTAAALLPFSISPMVLPAVAGGTLVTLALFFLKASLFTFGSGLAIVPFLHQGVVVENHWLNETQFLDSVAMGIITPGPVVITAAFIGYLVAGFSGALIGAFGVFFPVWVMDVVVGRFFLAHRNNPQIRGFVKGATAAAVGAIAGAAILLGQQALVDIPTGLIFLAALAALYFRKLKEPYVVALGGLVGLLLFRG